MKKFLVSAAAMVVFGAGSAFAQSVPAFGPSVTVSLEAEVGAVCGVQLNAGDGLNLEIDFGALTTVSSADQVQIPGGSATYVCNVPTGFTRTISSQNNGFLYRTGTGGGANNQIPWTMQHGGGSGLSFAALQLTTPRVNNYGGGFLNGQTGGLTFRASGVAVPSAANASITTTNVFAGDYTDVVTITISGF